MQIDQIYWMHLMLSSASKYLFTSVARPFRKGQGLMAALGRNEGDQEQRPIYIPGGLCQHLTSSLIYDPASTLACSLSLFCVMWPISNNTHIGDDTKPFCRIVFGLFDLFYWSVTVNLCVQDYRFLFLFRMYFRSLFVKYFLRRAFSSICLIFVHFAQILLSFNVVSLSYYSISASFSVLFLSLIFTCISFFFGPFFVYLGLFTPICCCFLYENLKHHFYVCGLVWYWFECITL